MLLLPVWTLWGPKLDVPVRLATQEPLAPEVSISVEQSARPAPQQEGGKRVSDAYIAHQAELPQLTWNWGWVVLIGYLSGLGVMLIRLTAGVLQALALRRRATLVDGVLVSPSCAAPVTVGWLRPVVILPEDWRNWSAAKLDAVLTHEREHVRRRDPLVQWLAVLNRSIFWFHPLAWWLARKLSDLAEEVCDAAVLRRGHTPTDYAGYLIELARSIERAGARVSLMGTSIGGGTLACRIRRILEARPLPPLSRARAIIAAALCLFLVIVLLACRPEQPSTLVQGQPSMNELMHRRAAEREQGEKRRQAVMDEVQKMTPAQARALEAELKTNPQDRDKLIRLVRYYQYRLSGQGFSAITLWYIEHEPTMPWSWNIDPAWDRAGYERGKKLWLAQLEKPGAGAAIYRNAAAFLEGGDKPLAEEVLLAAQKAHPNEDWVMPLGRHYAQALLGSTGPLAEFNVVRTLSMKEAHGEYAQSVRAQLAASNDPRLLRQTAQWLWSWGSRFLYRKENPLDFDVRALAKAYHERALALEPDPLAAVSLKLQLEETETSLRLRNLPPEQLSQAEKMKLLCYQLRHAVGPQKNPDEPEAKARELLALAAQNPNEPEYGNAIFFANMMLGQAAIRRGEKQQAARHLLAAAEAPPTDRLRYGYIDMTFARQLVDWGERAAVAQFLDRCARFNRRGKELAEWAAQLRQGLNPDLTPYTT